MQSNQEGVHAYTAGFHSAKQEYEKGYQAALQQFGLGGQHSQAQNNTVPGQMNRPYDDNVNMGHSNLGNSNDNSQMGGPRQGGIGGNPNDTYANNDPYNNVPGNQQDIAMQARTNGYDGDLNTQPTLADQALREAEIHDVPPIGTANKIKSKIPGHYRDGTKIPKEFREEY